VANEFTGTSFVFDPKGVGAGIAVRVDAQLILDNFNLRSDRCCTGICVPCACFATSCCLLASTQFACILLLSVAFDHCPL
jgi:hypothetical protein